VTQRSPVVGRPWTVDELLLAAVGGAAPLPSPAVGSGSREQAPVAAPAGRPSAPSARPTALTLNPRVMGVWPPIPPLGGAPRVSDHLLRQASRSSACKVHQYDSARPARLPRIWPNPRGSLARATAVARKNWRSPSRGLRPPPLARALGGRLRRRDGGSFCSNSARRCRSALLQPLRPSLGGGILGADGGLSVVSSSRAFVLLGVLSSCFLGCAHVHAPSMQVVNKIDEVQLRGRVIDEQGAALSGATLRLRGPALAVPLITTTDSSGQFAFKGVPEGREFDLVAEAIGFLSQIWGDIRLEPNQTVIVDLKMLPGSTGHAWLTEGPPAIDPREAGGGMTAEPDPVSGEPRIHLR